MSAKNFAADKGPPLAAFSVAEAALPAALGIPRKLIAGIRQEILTEGVEWRLVLKEIRLTPAAVTKIADAFASMKKGPAPEPAPAPPPAQASPDKVVLNEAAAALLGRLVNPEPVIELTVVTRSKLNPRIIYAIKPGGQEVAVRVRLSEFYRPKMTVRARYVAPQLYERVGRDPRFPGDKML